MQAGAREAKACEVLGISARTFQRWRSQKIGEDRRSGPKTTPANKLSAAERRKLLKTVNSPEFQDLPPKQIVPLLADKGRYLASESTIYRVLREEGQLKHREPSKPATRKRPKHLVATAPNQVWSWDITYLRSPIRGQFYYLYIAIDVFSRKIVAAELHERECSTLAAQMMEKACLTEGIGYDQLALHSDNGSPMKGAMLQATLKELGVAASFSRPSVSNDNPFSESLFRTAKYRPDYPSGPFTSFDAALAWVERFVFWYNHKHLHSGIRYVTPARRHAGEDIACLKRRHAVYMAARARHPNRWSRKTRNWTPAPAVHLNPKPLTAASGAA